MKKYFFVTAIFLSNIFIVAAQTKTSKFSVTVNFGGCLPIGKFAAKNFTDSSTAYAKLGIGGNVSLEYKIRPKLNLILNLAWQQNATNNDALSVDANKLSNDTTFFAYNIRKWQMAKILIGVSNQIPIKNLKRTFFTTKILAGIMNAWIPKTTVASVLYSPASSMIIGSARAESSFKEIKITLAYSLGVGIKTYINKSIFIQGNLEYAHAKANIPASYKMFRNGSAVKLPFINLPVPTPITVSPMSYYHQQLNTINFNAGIGINF